MENNNQKKPAPSAQDLNDQEQHRREKLALYREKGIDPFGHKYDVNSNSADLKRS